MIQYKLNDDGTYFLTGKCGNGEQVIFGIQIPDLVAVFFDADGQYLRFETRPLADSEDFSGLDDEDGPVFEELMGWQNQLASTPSPIVIRPFQIEDRSIGTREMPSHFEEFLQAPAQFDEAQSASLTEEIAQWKESGEYVMDWDEEYWIDADGEVVAS